MDTRPGERVFFQPRLSAEPSTLWSRPPSKLHMNAPVHMMTMKPLELKAQTVYAGSGKPSRRRGMLSNEGKIAIIVQTRYSVLFGMLANRGLLVRAARKPWASSCLHLEARSIPFPFGEHLQCKHLQCSGVHPASTQLDAAHIQRSQSR
jgi:hypothetical protein